MTYIELEAYKISNVTLKCVLDLIPNSKTKRRSWKPFATGELSSDLPSGELNKSVHKYRRANSSVEQAAGG